MPQARTAPLPPAGRPASDPAGVGVRPRPPHAGGPRQRIVRIVSLAYPSRCSGHRGHEHELRGESFPAEPWMASLVRSPTPDVPGPVRGLVPWQPRQGSVAASLLGITRPLRGTSYE